MLLKYVGQERLSVLLIAEPSADVAFYLVSWQVGPDTVYFGAAREVQCCEAVLVTVKLLEVGTV